MEGGFQEVHKRKRNKKPSSIHKSPQKEKEQENQNKFVVLQEEEMEEVLVERNEEPTEPKQKEKGK